jgi:hypothetical protein
MARIAPGRRLALGIVIDDRDLMSRLEQFDARAETNHSATDNSNGPHKNSVA